jgi:hypothetical protein
MQPLAEGAGRLVEMVLGFGGELGEGATSGH